MSTTCPKRQTGFSLVTAVFIIVVLAALGVFMVSISGLQQTSSALDLLGARAYQASRSGIEWGAYQVLRNSSGVYATDCLSAPLANPASSSVALGGTLAEFTVNVSCGSVSAVEAANTIWLYQLTSNAQRGVVGSTDYVERQLQVTLGR